MSTLAFSGINFFFSKPIDHDKKESQKLDLVIGNIQRARDIWNEDILSIKCWKKRKRQEHISTMFKQCKAV